ncbi:hypothetical protein BDV97DRAFT_4309 [Delphinella strobiligena]|nr:hypothetical protein BDV97DRAFT_4309 [Delphinella strobiligena]
MKLSAPIFVVSMLALAPASAYDTSVHCTTLGKVQNATNDDITKGLAAWFGNSSVGSSCNQPANTSQFCPAAGQQETDCYLQAAYNVWDNSMGCESYYQLQQQVQNVCGLGGGYTDCGCAVVSGTGSNKCLIASFVYHASGEHLSCR